MIVLACSNGHAFKEACMFFVRTTLVLLVLAEPVVCCAT